MHVRPRRLVPGHALALTLLIGCTGGEDPSNTSFGGSFTASQASQVSTADPSMASSGESSATTGPTTSATGVMDPTTTGPVTATEAMGTTTDDPGSETGPVDATTTGVDPSTTTGVDPSTTTGVDPSTTTDVDPSTTTGADDTTGEPPPPPPPKDPQPVNGLYEHCLDNTPCDMNLTDGCFMIQDDMMKVYDGYCTIVCSNVNDCGAKPNVPATQECINIAPMQNVCAMRCKGVADCPTGMACTNLSLPNNQTGMFCT